MSPASRSFRVFAFALALLGASLAGSVSARTPAPAIDVPPDRSLTAQEYAALGLPAVEPVWSDAELTKAASVLTAIASRAPEQLPRHASGRSGAVFARLTSRDTLARFKDRALPLNVRMPLALNYYDAFGRTFKLYVSAFAARHVSDADMVELMGTLLEITEALNAPTEEFLATLDPGDPKYPVRMKGLQQMRSGMAEVVTGTITTLTERHAYRTETLVRLAGSAAKTFPALFRLLSPEARKAALASLEALLADPGSRPLRGKLEPMYAKLKGG